jgi:hypothetical protein
LSVPQGWAREGAIDPGAAEVPLSWVREPMHLVQATRVQPGTNSGD